MIINLMKLSWNFFTYVGVMYVCRLFQHYKLFEVFLHDGGDDRTVDLSVGFDVFFCTLRT